MSWETIKRATAELMQDAKAIAHATSIVLQHHDAKDSIQTRKRFINDWIAGLYDNDPTDLSKALHGHFRELRRQTQILSGLETEIQYNLTESPMAQTYLNRTGPSPLTATFFGVSDEDTARWASGLVTAYNQRLDGAQSTLEDALNTDQELEHTVHQYTSVIDWLNEEYSTLVIGHELKRGNSDLSVPLQSLNEKLEQAILIGLEEEQDELLEIRNLRNSLLTQYGEHIGVNPQNHDYAAGWVTRQVATINKGLESLAGIDKEVIIKSGRGYGTDNTVLENYHTLATQLKNVAAFARFQSEDIVEQARSAAVKLSKRLHELTTLAAREGSGYLAELFEIRKRFFGGVDVNDPTSLIKDLKEYTEAVLERMDELREKDSEELETPLVTVYGLARNLMRLAYSRENINDHLSDKELDRAACFGLYVRRNIMDVHQDEEVITGNEDDPYVSSQARSLAYLRPMSNEKARNKILVVMERQLDRHAETLAEAGDVAYSSPAVLRTRLIREYTDIIDPSYINSEQDQNEHYKSLFLEAVKKPELLQTK